MSTAHSLIESLNSILWGPLMLLLLGGTGILLTIRLKGLQITHLWYSLKLIFKTEKGTTEGEISHFQALTTALAATVGTGNIAGVATAIHLGGPGAIFWMWMTGFVGMATKYAEAFLAVKFRQIDTEGRVKGGPMYYISKGMGSKKLASLFAFFTVLASFGIGSTVQSNSIADVVQTNFSVAPHWTSLIITLFVGAVTCGGIKSIGKVTSVIVPCMIVFYLMGSLFILCTHIDQLPRVIHLIFDSAFTGTAATGGFAGATMKQALQRGISRGIFSNESGMGSSPIAAAAAKTKSPTRQALVSMTQTFIDTLVVCSMTGFVILITNSWTSGATGASLTYMSFSEALPGSWGGNLVTWCLVFFAYSTILGWSYYSEQAIDYLFGKRSKTPFRLIFLIAVYLGGIMNLELVWSLADAFNALMSIPNLIALIALSGIVAKETKNSVYS